MFQRLIQAGHKHYMLDTSYRMHPSLLRVPNSLFYNNFIKCGYTPSKEKQFLFAEHPFLFIDVDDGVEELKGTSFLNHEEVEVVSNFIEHALEVFKENDGSNGLPM